MMLYVMPVFERKVLLTFHVAFAWLLGNNYEPIDRLTLGTVCGGH